MLEICVKRDVVLYCLKTSLFWYLSYFSMFLYSDIFPEETCELCHLFEDAAVLLFEVLNVARKAGS